MKSKLKILTMMFIAALVVLIVVTYRTMMNQERQVYFVYYISLLFLVFAAVALLVWISTAVISPLKELKQAIQKAKEGNLNDILDIDRHDELGEVCEEFEGLRMKLKSDEEKRETFERENKELIGNISHDLKTPITVIKGHVEGIMDGIASTPEKLDRYLKTILSKVNDMNTLIDELTYYTKIDTNRVPYQFEKISAVEFFDDCAEDIMPALETENVEFRYHNSVSHDVQIIADPEQLKRVINNIVNNSVKYMDKEEKKITLALTDSNDFIQAAIEDNGRGIATKDLPYIFDRFYRTDASRNSNRGGSGIGLSIVKKIIEDHEGKIWAQSREGEGTKLVFILRKYQEVPYEQDIDR